MWPLWNIPLSGLLFRGPLCLISIIICSLIHIKPCGLTKIFPTQDSPSGPLCILLPLSLVSLYTQFDTNIPCGPFGIFPSQDSPSGPLCILLPLSLVSLYTQFDTNIPCGPFGIFPSQDSPSWPLCILLPLSLVSLYTHLFPLYYSCSALRCSTGFLWACQITAMEIVVPLSLVISESRRCIGMGLLNKDQTATGAYGAKICMMDHLSANGKSCIWMLKFAWSTVLVQTSCIF